MTFNDRQFRSLTPPGIAIVVPLSSAVSGPCAAAAPPPAVVVPDDFAAALDNHPDARAAFDKMARSHRRRYVDWIEEAKRPKTRAQRIQRAVEMILGNTNARSAR